MQIWQMHSPVLMIFESSDPVFLVQADIIHQQNVILMVCQEGH